MLMKRHVPFRSACAAAVSAALLLALPALAQTARPAAKPAPKAARAAPAPAQVVPEASPDQVKAADLVFYGRYACEFDQTVEIAQSPKHSSYVDVRHGKGVWLMKPVLSTTGAIRLEDVKNETLMVQISSKSMLLNVKTGRRVVDECITEKQRELVALAKAAKEAEEAAAKTAADPTVATTPGTATSAPR